MTAARALTEMAKFKPKEPRVDYRVPLKESLSEDLEVVARVRTKVNKKVGDGTKISVTEMLLEEAEELRDTSFAEWGGKPVDEAAEDELVEKLIKVYEATGTISPEPEPKKKTSSASR